MENDPSQSSRKRWVDLKEALSIFGSIHSIVLLVGLLVSIFVQILPVLTNPVLIEIARFSTIVFLSVLSSYVLIRLSARTTYRYLETLNRILIYDMRIGAYFNVLVPRALLGKEGKLEQFDYVLQQARYKEEALSGLRLNAKKYPGLMTLPRKGCINVIIEIASIWKIPFEQLASHLCEKLGKDNAKRLIDNETILEFYGKDSVSMWKSIFE